LWLKGTPPNKSLDADRGRLLSFRGVASLRRPRQVSFIVRPQRDARMGDHLFQQCCGALMYNELEDYEDAIQSLTDHLRTNPGNAAVDPRLHILLRL
jgi:hypothetical protein